MNKETFINYIEDNHLLGNSSINELTELVNEFPYCSTTHILLSMNLLKDDHFRYDAEMRRTAIYAADRNVLRKHIRQLSKQVETAVLPDEDVEVVEVVNVEESETTAIVETESVEEIAEIHEEQLEDIARKETEPEAELQKDLVGAKEKEPAELIREFQETTLQNHLEVVEEPPEKSAEAKKTDADQEEQLNPEEEIAEEVITLKTEEAEVVIAEELEKPKLEKEDTLAELRKIVENRLKQIEKDRQLKAQKEELELKPPKRKKPEKAASELIDSFIKTEPSITRHKAAFFNPADAAKDSVMDEENIVSETLAEIYFDQKKFKKSIRIYKKLSLKFPEKSSYFAARIEKVAEELKK